MAMTKIKELRDKPVDQLQAMLKERRRHLFDLRSQSVTEKLEDPTQLGKTRREIAKIMTILRQQEIAKQPAKQAAAKETKQPAAAK